MNKQSFQQYRSWLISAAIVAGVALWLATGAGGDEESEVAAGPAASAASEQFAVRVRNQVAEEVVRTISVNGKTAPARTVEINAETDGRVISVGAERGERVAAGGLIVRLDPRDREQRLAQASAAVTQRQAEFEARERLIDASYVSDAQLKEAAALLEAARAELRRAELDLEYAEIRAPFDGALQDRHVEVGDFVSIGDPVATYIDDRSIVVDAAISEFDAGYVARGDEAEARLATGETVTGIVRYVAPVADDATRTFAVELEVENPDGKLRAGMSAELRIPAERVFAHRISPSLLTLDDQGEVGVKTINDEGIVEFFPADIALSSSEGLFVAGLPAAARIITVGQGFVTVGSYVDSVPEDASDQAVAIKSGESKPR